MDFGGKINFPYIYFRPTSEPGNELVKNNKVKDAKKRRKRQNFYTILVKTLQIPNLHHIHDTIKTDRCKYIFYFFRYLFIGSLPRSLRGQLMDGCLTITEHFFPIRGLIDRIGRICLILYDVWVQIACRCIPAIATDEIDKNCP